MMRSTKFLDVVQEDNESISSAMSVSGTDPGSHCFQEGEHFGVSQCFPSRVSKPLEGKYYWGWGIVSMATMTAAL
jgi:hypothetical protein